jgi:hypothetical protein
MTGAQTKGNTNVFRSDYKVIGPVNQAGEANAR